jgi:hypothetical protein
MKTTFVIFFRDPLLPASTWATISPAVRFRPNPIVPVAQNAQSSGHPTCVETHSVRRFCPSSPDASPSRDADAGRNQHAFDLQPVFKGEEKLFGSVPL